MCARTNSTRTVRSVMAADDSEIKVATDIGALCRKGGHSSAAMIPRKESSLRKPPNKTYSKTVNYGFNSSQRLKSQLIFHIF